MPLAARSEHLSVDEYLAGEERSRVKHEYIGGETYAMADATKDQNQIALNIYTVLRAGLRGGKCRAFVSDIKVRLEIGREDIFYYPDVVVGCDPRDRHPGFLQYPKAIVEVLSESTERLDRMEKRTSYQTIETLEEYVLVAQDRAEVTLFRRANQWQPEVYNSPDQKVDLPSLGVSLPLELIYEGVPV
jgi:Uma2 family endonuclease